MKPFTMVLTGSVVGACAAYLTMDDPNYFINASMVVGAALQGVFTKLDSYSIVEDRLEALSHEIATLRHDAGLS